jgi:hypothetical protein
MITTKEKATNGGVPAQPSGIFGDTAFTQPDGSRFADLEIQSPFAPGGGLGPRPAGEAPPLQEKPYVGPQGERKKIA